MFDVVSEVAVIRLPGLASLASLSPRYYLPFVIDAYYHGLLNAMRLEGC